MDNEQKEKFYIPVKLNRSSMIGPYNLLSAGIMVAACIPIVIAVVSTGSMLWLTPLLAYALLAARLGERSIGTKVKNIIKHMAKPQQYLLKESIQNEDDRFDKIRHT